MDIKFKEFITSDDFLEKCLLGTTIIGGISGMVMLIVLVID